MIEDYLKKEGKDELTNTFTAKMALEGETVEAVVYLDEELTLFVMKTGCSFLLLSDGAFKTLGREKTKALIDEFEKQNANITLSYYKLKNLSIFNAKQESQAREEGKNGDQNPTT